LFYGTNSKELKKGDKVSGDLGGGNIGAMWGKLYRYHKLPEFSFTEMDIKVVSEGNVVEPKTITFDKLPDNLNAFVKIENVVFDGTAYKIGDEVLTIKDQFYVVEAAGLEANTTYTIEGMVGLYDETHQLYPISFTKQGGGSTGISTVKTVRVDDGAIYNLKGQKVEADYKGLVIKNGKKIINK
jgi:hypothetical protein